jgi:F-type H+-transporting ATPase subunit gamma
MAKTREIKKRIKAVGNIRRITKTMQMIATSKFARAQQASVASKPFTEALFSLVGELQAAGVGGEVGHPLLSPPKGDAAQDLTLIITSDRGLCGPYNGSVLRTAMGLLRQNPRVKAGQIELVGKKGVSFLKFNGVPVAQQHAQFGDKPSVDKVYALADEYMRKYIAGEIATVRIVSMKYISAGKQTPNVLQLLPFQPPESAASASGAAEKKAPAQYEFSPSAADLLNDLLPAAVRSVLFQVFNDAIVSEHVARMVAMKAATDNAGKAGKRLTRVYNRARQAQITTELTEIISGAAALS